MKSSKIPTPEQIEKVVASLGHAEYNRYFFDRLDNPNWLKPLKEKKFFSSPPTPIRDESRGTITFSVWPELRYLVRMAPYAPEIVLDIILDIPDTDNIRVHDDLADAAVALPAALAVKLVPKAKLWLKAPHQSLLPAKLAQLAVNLGAGGEIDAALDLLKSTLEVLPDLKPILVPEPRARFDAFHYGEVVRRAIPPLISATGTKLLLVLSDLLDFAVKASQSDDDGKDTEDYSYIWQPAIEYGSSASPQIKSILVAAVREAAEGLVSQKIASAEEIVGLLEKRRWAVFQRIALNLLRVHGAENLELVAQRVREPARFDYPSTRREYCLLEAKFFSLISSPDQKRILDWIKAGPEFDLVKTRLSEFAGEAVSDEHVFTFIKRWQRDRLAVIQEVVSTEWRTQYEKLIVETGPPDDLTAGRTFKGGAFAPSSPREPEELAAMSIEAMIDYLKSWRATGKFGEPTVAGLGRELATIVAKDPKRFSAESERFIGVDPTYIREFLEAFHGSSKKQDAFDWEKILKLCLWVAEQPREIEGRKGGLTDQDPDWGWTRNTVTRLVSSGLEAGTISFFLRDLVWKVILPLTTDSHPSEEEETEYLDQPNADPYTLSINTTRGQAIDSAIRYALWVRREIDSLPDAKEKISRGFDEMPEVKNVLDQHLDTAVDPSVSVRATYGRWIPWLQVLDRNWVIDNLKRLFPHEKQWLSLRNATWQTYITTSDVYDDVFELLREEYAFAVDHLGEGRSKTHVGHPDERLAQHLIVLYWRGKLALEEKGGLLERFFNTASAKIRGEAITLVGRSVNKETTKEILDRLKTLWESRLQAARNAKTDPDANDEMVAFGWWFASQAFDDNWSITQLLESLKISHRTHPDHLVIERLVDIGKNMPMLAVEALGMITEGDKEGWGILGLEPHARAILRVALGSDHAGAKATATNLIHKLGSRGYFQFKELLTI